MKTFIHKLIYSPSVNFVLRNIALAIYKISSKKLIAISGKVSLKFETKKIVLNTNQTNFVTQELFFEGAENYEFTKLFADLITKSKVFFDIGSNIGYFSILGSKINPSCKIYACEPSIGSLHYLKLNIEDNLCTNVQVIDSAISNQNGELTFHEVVNQKYPWLRYNLNGSNSLESKFINKNFSSYQVKVENLGKIVADNCITQIDLIKLDTECTEHHILDSAVPQIDQFKPIIICEVYDVIETEIDEIVNKKLNNYKIYQFLHAENKLRKIETISGITKNKLERNFVFCPDEKVHLIENYLI
jgi:FkbM family methyltransferase